MNVMLNCIDIACMSEDLRTVCSHALLNLANHPGSSESQVIIIIIIIIYFLSTRFTDNDIYKYVRGFTLVAVPPILYVIFLLSKEG